MKFRQFIIEGTAPTTGVLVFQSTVTKYPGVKNVHIDDWVDYSGSTSYTVFVELENSGRSRAAMDPRKAGIVIDDKINIAKLRNAIQKEAKKLGLFVRSITSPTKKREVTTFHGEKKSYPVGYDSDSFEIDMVENK